MENINFRGIPTSLFLNGPNVEIVSDPQTGISIGSATTTTTDLSAAPPVVFDDHQCAYISATYDANANRVVIAYQDTSTNYGTAVVGNVVGTGITFGTPVTFETANTYWSSAVYDPSKQKVVIAYGENTPTGHYLAKARVGTVDPSDNSISFGSAVVFESASIYHHHMTFDSTNSKVIIAYRDTDNSDYGKAVVGTVSGTSISFGTPVVFQESDTRYITAAYDSTNNKVVIAYNNNGNNGYGTVIRGTVSGTSISFDTPSHVFHSDSTDYPSIAYDSGNSKLVVAYRDNENDLGEATVIDSTTLLSTNLNTENFIGFSDAAYSNGQTANIQIISSVDDAQTGLTTGSLHYVQNDGTLSTTAGTPSVEAGTALSDTKIRIKS